MPARSGVATGIGLAVAGVGLSVAFRGPNARFWTRMTRLGAALGSIAVVGEPRLPGLNERRSPARAIAIGTGSAAVLYVAFVAGDRLSRRLLPGGDADIERIYAVREERSDVAIAARLVAVIAPAEELFWRGLVQGWTTRRLGRVRGAVAAATAYAAVHLGSGNLTLVGAAAVAGAWWSALRAAGVPMAALVWSHAVWDVTVFLVRPPSRPMR